MENTEEKVIMTPKCKTPTSTTIVVERKVVDAAPSEKIHVAGGDHTGIIINKEKVYGKYNLDMVFCNSIDLWITFKPFLITPFITMSPFTESIHLDL